ncbi:unnamed protein product [Urochloa humidicola]
MANFQCNPAPYLPAGAHVEDGWQRPARSRVALGGEPPRRHEEYAIISLDPMPEDDFVLQALHDVGEHLEQAFPVRILSSFRSPLGLGLVQFQSSTQRQTLIDASPIPFINNTTIRVLKHDEALNLRACNYTRLCRLMILAFPLDYQTMDFFKAAVAPFGRLITWYEGPNKSKTYIDCLVLSPARIPRSVVVSQGSLLGGNGRSWTAPVFIIGGHFPDVFPGEEDPMPVDGNPHPAHGHIAHANPDVDQNWIHELAGAGNAVLQDLGVNQNQMQQAMEDIMAQGNNVGGNGDDWPAWDDVIANGVEGNHQQVLPQHPEQPQDEISFHHSGSSANFLRANGPDIHLTVEMVRQGQFGRDSSSSSSSNEATSQTAMEVSTDGYVPQFTVFWSAFDQPEPSTQNNLTASGSLKRSWNMAFHTSQSTPADNVEDLTRAIVPYQPVLHSVLLQIWAQKVDEANKAGHSTFLGTETAETVMPSLGATDTLLNETKLPEAEGVPGMMMHEAAPQNAQTEQHATSAKKCLLSAFAVAADSTHAFGLPPRPPKKVTSLPTEISDDNRNTPLVDDKLRRSPRLNKDLDGYQHCQLVDAPRKKRRGPVNKTSTKLNQTQNSANSLPVPLEIPAVKQNEVQSPIPIDVLKGWGVECGVPPSEITDDLLLQKHSPAVPDEDTTNTK